MKRTFSISLFFALIFFIASLFTLDGYNISWDETIHFRRGQTYLHYFLTGEKNYNNLQKYNLQGTNGDPDNVPVPRSSLYQNDFQNDIFFSANYAHPPINDEIAALFNRIFYQKLGIMNDVASYHLFNIISASLLVFVVVYFMTRTFGVFPAVVSFLSLSTYPLFWAESHFNIKDPPEAAFFAATIWTFYESLNGRKIYWLILTFLFFALALGTKFNALFIPVIFFLYLIFRFRKYFRFGFKKFFSVILKPGLLYLVAVPIVGFAVLIISWPFLWENILENLILVFKYYKEVGTGTNYQANNFYLFGFNTYPLQWIIFTSPPFVLLLALIGTISAWINRNEHKQAAILWLIWLGVALLRVIVPGASVYGGIRQVLEFLPATALLSGLGAWQVGIWLKKKRLSFVFKLFLVVIFAGQIFILYRMHPNENVYFNSLIGGLSGAYVKNFPSAGNSFGNAYLSGTKWLNDNAEKNAKLALIQGTASNAPILFLRSDIDFLVGNNIDTNETHFSGIERKGEYIMELTFNDAGKDFYYIWEYVNNFLVPVYEVRVDNVSILKIWKNDVSHTNEKLILNEEIYENNLKIGLNGKIISLDLGKEAYLSHVELSFLDTECSLIGNVDTSTDGNKWIREKDGFPQLQIGRKSNVNGNTIKYYFAGRKAKQIRFWFEESSLCKFEKPQVKVYLLE